MLPTRCRQKMSCVFNWSSCVFCWCHSYKVKLGKLEMHLFNTKKRVPHPGRIFQSHDLFALRLSQTLGKLRHSQPLEGLTFLPRKGPCGARRGLVFLSPTNPAQLALLCSAPCSTSLMLISHRQCLGNPCAKTFCSHGAAEPLHSYTSTNP